MWISFSLSLPFISLCIPIYIISSSSSSSPPPLPPPLPLLLLPLCIVCVLYLHVSFFSCAVYFSAIFSWYRVTKVCAQRNRFVLNAVLFAKANVTNPSHLYTMCNSSRVNASNRTLKNRITECNSNKEKKNRKRQKKTWTITREREIMKE